MKHFVQLKIFVVAAFGQNMKNKEDLVVKGCTLLAFTRRGIHLIMSPIRH